MVTDQLISTQNRLVVTFLVGTHGKIDGALLQPLSLQECLSSRSNSDDRIRLGRFLGVIHHDDFALDIVLHVLFKLGGGSGHGVINIQLLDIKDSGQGLGLCTALDTGAIRDILAQFTDYVTTSEWAREGLAFCYQEDILDQSALEIRPTAAIKRCEIAQMLFNLLGSANLL